MADTKSCSREMATVIQGLWIGDALSPLERLSIASFLKNGHEYHLYCYEPIKNVPPGAVIKDGNEILPAFRIFKYEHGFGRGSYSAFSNLFRYKLLFEKGGWWTDADVVCVKPFDFTAELVLSGEYHRDYPRQVASCVIKAPAGHPILGECLTAAQSADPRTVALGQIGPMLLSSVVHRAGLEHMVSAPEVFCPVPWWEWEFFIGEGNNLRSWVKDTTRGIHLWHELWRARGIKGSKFSATSPIAQLLAEHSVN